MNSAKISFAFNEKEGLAELRRRQDEAGSPSLGKYVKQLVIEHLAHDGDDQVAQVVDSVERLRQAELQTATMVAELSRNIDLHLSAAAPAEGLEALRHSLAMMLSTILQHDRPLSQERAKQLARRLFKGGS